MNPFRSIADYETFIYELESSCAAIRRSTLVVIRRGATVAILRGELEFDLGLRLCVRERLTFDRSPGSIREYGYEVCAIANCFTGMIRNRILAIPYSLQLILIIATSILISNIIGFQLLG